MSKTNPAQRREKKGTYTTIEVILVRGTSEVLVEHIISLVKRALDKCGYVLYINTKKSRTVRLPGESEATMVAAEKEDDSAQINLLNLMETA